MLETFIQTLVRWLGLDHFTDHLNNYARRLILGNMINAIGMGLTMTLFLVYLHTIRGFSAGFSGLVMSWMAIIGMVINPAIGILIDKFGGRIVLINGLLIKAVGIIALSFITTKEQALMVATIMALGDAANWPAQTVCFMTKILPRSFVKFARNSYIIKKLFNFFLSAICRSCINYNPIINYRQN